MSDPHDHFTNAKNLAVDILRKETARTAEKIQEVATKAIQAVTIFAPGVTIDLEALTAELRHLFSVGVGSATVLEEHDPARHVPWLQAKKGTIQWRFWNRYMTYLERDFGMPPAVVDNLHELTDMILERLEEPQRDGPWDRRGMVVGSVQSGKTANYVGLINKSVDAGYKLIIVLAGIHSNLRSQTQLRLDEGVLGFDTQKSRKLNTDSRWVGVGKLPGERLVIHSLTSSAEDGDFNKRIAETIGVMVGGDPVVLVVKKNVSVLKNLLKWVLHVAGTDDPVTGQRVVRNVPLLLIDDEADNASINTKDRAKPGSDDVTAINGSIRMLLDSFEKSVYLGYTATPFANIFINPEAETPEHGEDLFPRSFIVSVKAPSNYVGPAKVFGLDGDADSGIPSHDALPVIREIDDYTAAFPPKHKKEHVPPELPPSLKHALRCFILACAARRARGQGKQHNSMLVHVTRFTNVQDHVVRLVRDELVGLQRRIEFGDGERIPSIRDELEELWNDEFVPVSEALGAEAGRSVSWEQVNDELHPAAAKIVVLPINGYAKEALDYKEHEAEGRSVIAVGGDKLSRGLTLEGLCVSYFLRTSRMYDTLMQMGRWFGYRPGYLDLCRLFTTGQLVGWYRHIALAEAELRQEFDYMVAAGLTPEQYGLRVRTHPDGMIITALNKMSHGRDLELSWAGVLVQTTQIPTDLAKVQHNLVQAKTLLDSIGNPNSGPDGGTQIWHDVPAAKVVEFVEALQFPPESARASGSRLGAFIRQQTTKPDPELTQWTVALVSVKDAPSRRKISDYDVGLVERTPEDIFSNSYSLKKANILNPADEASDFEGQTFTQEWFDSVSEKPELQNDLVWLQGQVGKVAWDVALGLTLEWQKTSPPKIRPPSKGETKRPNGRVLRVLRRRSHALLLIYPLAPLQEVGLKSDGPPAIGLALSFPTSDSVLGVEYRVNRVWDAELQEDSAYDD